MEPEKIKKYINRELPEMDAWLLEDELCIPPEYSFYPEINLMMIEIITGI